MYEFMNISSSSRRVQRIRYELVIRDVVVKHSTPISANFMSVTLPEIRWIVSSPCPLMIM